jgi:hypothetical protein
METLLYPQYLQRYAMNRERIRSELRAALEPSVRGVCKAKGVEFTGVDDTLIDSYIQRIVQERGALVGGIEFWFRKSQCLVQYTQDDGFPELAGRENLETILSIEAHTPFFEVFTIDEAVERWGMSLTELNCAIEDGEFMRELQYRKIGEVTLITRQAMYQRYGNCKTRTDSNQAGQVSMETITLGTTNGIPGILTDFFGEDYSFVEII